MPARIRAYHRRMWVIATIALCSSLVFAADEATADAARRRPEFQMPAGTGGEQVLDQAGRALMKCAGDRDCMGRLRAPAPRALERWKRAFISWGLVSIAVLTACLFAWRRAKKRKPIPAATVRPRRR